MTPNQALRRAGLALREPGSWRSLPQETTLDGHSRLELSRGGDLGHFTPILGLRREH